MALLLVASTVVAGAILVFRPLPTIDADIRLLGLQQRAEVLRDAFGVPHIYAQNAYDLFFLQGYVTAQDRLFQMDLYRRAGSGTLAAVLGEAALESDRTMRTYGLARVAARELDLLRETTREMLRAYADGVNKFLEGHGESLPLEFVLLGYRPAPWTAVDSIVVAKLQAFDAAGNLGQELLRAGIALRLGTDALATLMPDPAGSPVEVDQRAWSLVAPLLSVTSAPPVAAFVGAAGGAGSNCWALAGSRTATGRPILAGDTHLPVRNPSIWYEIGLEGAGFKLVGFSFAGLPGIAIGHNARIAWSLTYAYADTQDLFVERPDPSDARRFEYRGSFEPATIVRETIAVKGRPVPVTLDVAITRHGPIITPVLKQQTAQLALRWTALDPGTTLDFVYDVSRAANWSEFRAAAAEFVGATASVCYADVDGHIGYQLMGRLPQRSGDGSLPVPGWTGDYDWTGLVPAELNPSYADPQGGAVINANDRPSADVRSAGYVGEWDPGFRAATIASRLSGLEKTDLSAMRAIQTDLVSPPVVRFREALLAATTSRALAHDAQRLVATWNGALTRDSPAAAIYESWLVHVVERTFKDRLGPLYDSYLDKGRATFALYELIARPDDRWFSTMSRDALAGLALDDAVNELGAKLGMDPRAWRWGALHTITFEHPLAVGPLGALLNIGPLPRPGDGFSLDNGGYPLGRPYRQTAHASERMIADLADLDRSLSITPEGESAQPGSRHRSDQTPLWNAGDYKPMRFSRDRLGEVEGRLVFRPR